MDNKTVNPILVDLKTLMRICNCGRIAAEKIGIESNSIVRVGRRKLYNLSKIQKWLDEKCDTQGE